MAETLRRLAVVLCVAAVPAIATARPGPESPAWQPTFAPAPGEGEGQAADAADDTADAPAPTQSETAPRSARTAAVRGLVTDATTGEPLAGAEVRAIDGDGAARTGPDGRFEIALAPGRHRLRVSYPLYRSVRVDDVVAGRGRAAAIDIALSPSPSAIEEIVVFAEPETRTEAGLLEVRRNAATVSDGLSKQEMSRGPDSSASDAIRRIVSATVEDGRYVLIRGLGGRYVTALLNGAVLPSPEPDRQAVPLDLFPTRLLSNLTILKSYAARYPGAFAGGTLLIESSSYPDDFELSIKLSTSADTASTFGAAGAYDGGGLDGIGFDDGSRALPDAVPGDRPARVGDGIDPAAIERIGESFANVWSVDQRDAAPSLSVGVTAGDTLEPGGRELGYLATFGYGHSTDVEQATVGRLRSSGGELGYREQLDTAAGSRVAKLGGLVAAGLELSKKTRLSAVSLYSHTGESSALSVSGVSESDGMPIESTRLRFVERGLSFTQLRSDSDLPELGNLSIAWQGNLSLTSRSEPDTRDITYFVTDDQRRRFKNETGSGERFFSDLSERALGTGADASFDATERLRVGLGASLRHSDRGFSARRFRYDFVGSDPSVLFTPADQIFSADNIGPNFRLEERTLPSDAYEAQNLVAAGYLTGDLHIAEPLRVSAGLRYELNRQELSPGSPFALGAPPMDASVAHSDADLLPAASAVYALTPAMNLRAAYSYTLARPMFRELAPFLFFDYTRRTSVSGNPELERSRIHNADLRWEWFTGETDLVAASLFYKRFHDPIEQVIVSATGGDLSFANAAGARTVGAELELRSSLERFAPELRGVRAWANLTLIQSRVELGAGDVGSQTSATRPLQGQSPVVVNLGASYSRTQSGTEIALLYNVFGRRIEEVGFDTLPDVYERPLHRLDLAASQRLRDDLVLELSAENLLGQDVVLEQGGLDVYRHRPGVGFSLGLAWTP